MTTSSLTRRAALGAGIAGLLVPGTARAAYPDRALRWIVAYPAGGGSDALARLLGGALSPRLGQPVVIENRPGGATNIGAEAAARSAPDGYTVLTADNGTLVFNPALFRKLPYDPDRDFQPIRLFARFHLMVAVRQDAASRDIADFLARAKAEPGSMACGSAGVGSPHHLALERLARAAGAQFNHVPYRGAAPAMNDLLAGSIGSALLDYATAGGVIRAKRIRPLAVLSAERLPELPDVPTIREALGLPDFTAHAWQGLVAPAATPAPVAERLTTELAAVLGEPAVQARLREIGVEPLSDGPDRFRALIAEERATWVPLIRDLGITLDG